MELPPRRLTFGKPRIVRLEWLSLGASAHFALGSATAYGGPPLDITSMRLKLCPAAYANGPSGKPVPVDITVLARTTLALDEVAPDAGIWRGAALPDVCRDVRVLVLLVFEELIVARRPASAVVGWWDS